MSAIARAWTEEQGASSPGDVAAGAMLDSGTHEVIDPRAARIRAAMAPGVLGVVFQPVIDLRRGAIAGAEALARFAMEPARTPDVWFNEAWDVGLGVDLEIVAIRGALAALDRLPSGTHMAINASPQTLISAALESALEGVPGHRVIIELTEHAQVDDYALVKATIERLRHRGIRLAIDDAGAGFSSLQHILHLRPDLIKLDRSLTQGIDGDPVRYALAAALVTFARSLDAEICAEGIERESELAALQHLGIAYGQGYFLGRPLPLPLAPPPAGVWLSERPVRMPSGRARMRSGRVSLPGRPWVDVANATLSMPPVPITVDLKLAPEPEPAPRSVSDEAFDRVTRWSTSLLHAPIAIFTLTSRGNHVLQSSVGLTEASFRAGLFPFLRPLFEAVATAGPVVVPDATVGPCVRDLGCLGLVGGIACAGVPVFSARGVTIGTLSVIDSVPHAWTEADEQVLRELAASLATELELRMTRGLLVPGRRREPP